MERRLKYFFLRWHKKIAIIYFIPLLITTVTGILVSLKSIMPWLQPVYPSVNSSLVIGFDQILTISKGVKEANIESWQDVKQIDIRPQTGNIRVRSKHNHWEIQIEGEKGQIITSAPRRVGLLLSIHEGQWFGSFFRWAIFLPSAFGLLFLIGSGLLIILNQIKFKSNEVK